MGTHAMQWDPHYTACLADTAAYPQEQVISIGAGYKER